MSTLKEQIAVMQHFADGGKVECGDKKENEWTIIPSPEWDWGRNDYRKHVAPPVPRECWVNEYEMGLNEIQHKTSQDADKNQACNRIDCIHMREVMEGES